MADKQIIIDGKECRYWFRPKPSDYRKCSLRGKNDNCDEIKDCFVKELLGKLALKEQECEELKKECERLKNELSTYGATGICETCTEKSVLKCDQLEKENDLYKNAHKTEQDRRRSYENALTEIKEIVEQQCNICVEIIPIDEYKDCEKCWQDKILQKISEVENE